MTRDRTTGHTDRSTARRRATRRPLFLLLALLALVSAPFAAPGRQQALAATPISITNTPSAATVASGAQLTYTIVITNTGGAQVTNVTMEDQINGMTGLSLTSKVSPGTAPSCPQPSTNDVKCTAPTLAGGEVWTVTITGTVTAASGTTLNDTVTATGTKSSQTFTVSAVATVQVSGGTGGGGLPDLTVSISAPASVVVNSSLTYTLTVNNIGTANATNIPLVDTLPAGVAFVSATGTSLFACAFSAPSTVNCSGGAVAAGANATITIKATAPATTGTIVNTAQVNPTNSVAESNYANNNASATTTVTSTAGTGSLTIKKTASSPADPSGAIVTWPTQTGLAAQLTYTIVVTNTASTRADGVNMTDGTQGLDAASITATVVPASLGATCKVQAPLVTCTATNPTLRLDPGQTMTVTIIGNVIASPGSTITNTATVNGNIGNQGISASASVITTVVPSIDLTVTQSSSPNPVHAASALTYTMVVGNSGYMDATNVEVRNPLPAGVLQPKVSGSPTFLFSASSGSGFTCTIDASNVVDCTGGTIKGSHSSGSPGGTTATIMLFMIAPETTGNITNTATVNPHNIILESNYTNNSFTLTTAVQTGIDLCVPSGANCPAGSVTAYCPFAAPGPLDCSTTPKGVATSSRLTYVIKVPNQGTQDTTGVVVQDTLPTGTTFISASGDHNFTCAQSGGIVTCSGGIINGTYTTAASTPPTTPFPPPNADQDVATVTIIVFSTAAPSAMGNQVRVDPQNAIAEFDKTNNLNTLSTAASSGGANPYIDLSIAKAQISPTTLTNGNPQACTAPCEVAPNGTLTYELTISNDVTANPLTSLSPAEEADATNVAVRDFLPQGARFISATSVSGGFLCNEAPAAGQPNTEEVDCTGGTVPHGGSVKIDVTMFAPGTPGTYTTQALVDPNNAIAEGDETNNSASITTKVGIGNGGDYIDLTLGMKADKGTGTAPYAPGSVVPGGAITYMLTVGNTGTGDAYNVEVKDTLPAGSTKFISAMDSQPNTVGAFTCSQSVVGTVDCTGGTVNGTVTSGSATGGTRTIIIVVDASNQSSDFPQTVVPNDITITNQAIVNPSGAIPESNTTNNSALWQTLVHSVIDLTISPTSSVPTATQSSNQTITLTVTNNGDGTNNATANGVQVHDPLPVGMIVTGVDFTPTNAWQCQVLQSPVNVVDCSGNIPGGSSGNQVVINIHVFITATDNTKLDNQACVDPNNLIVEFNETNNCSTSETVVGHVDMAINKSAAAGTVTPGGTETYTLTVSNNGTAKADKGSVTVNDDLASTLTIVGTPTTTNGFTCTGTTSLTCTNSGADLAAGSSATITYTVSVPTTATAPITNTATVSDTDANDTNTSDKSSSATVNVSAQTVNLQVKSVTGASAAGPGQVTPPSTLTFTIVATDNGTKDPAGSVTVRNALTNGAAGMTLVGAFGTNGFTCDQTVSSSIGGSGNPGLDCKGSLPPGASTTLTLKFVVGPGAINPIVLTSTIDPDHVYQPTNTPGNSQTATISVNGALTCTGCKDVEASIIGSPDPVSSGGTMTYSAAVVNVGDTDIQGTSGKPALSFFITLDASIDVGAATVAVSGPNPVGNAWTCVTATAFFAPNPVPGGFSPGANSLVCQGDLLVGQGVTVSVSGTTTAASGSTITTTIDGDGTENAFTPQTVLPEPSSTDAPDEEGVTTAVS